ASGTVAFQVWVDGKKVSDTGKMTGSTPVQPINVNLTGKSELQLVLTDSGDGRASDHGDWADARITCSGVSSNGKLAGTTTDTTPPTVSSVSRSSSTKVAVNSAAGATFSEAMDPATINGSTVKLIKQ